MTTSALPMTCPNCSMPVKTDVRMVVDGKTLLFCNKKCMARFGRSDAAQRPWQ